MLEELIGVVPDDPVDARMLLLRSLSTSAFDSGLLKITQAAPQNGST